MFELFSTVGLLLGICVLLYIYGRWPYSVWHRLGVPGPPPTVFLGHILDLNTNQGGLPAFRRWRQEYGPVYGIYSSRTPILVVTDPTYLRRILVADFKAFNNRFLPLDGVFTNAEMKSGLFFVGGQQWNRIRSLVSPAFSSSKLKLITHHVNTCAQRLANSFRDAAQTGELVDVKRLSSAYSLDVIASAAFSMETGVQSNFGSTLMQNVTTLFSIRPLFTIVFMIASVVPHILIPFLRHSGMGFFNRDQIHYFDTMVREIIRNRLAEESPQRRSDILQMLMDAEAVDNEMTNGSAKTLNREEIIAQWFVILIGGFETTSTALQFILYELAGHPDIQEKVIEEIDIVIGNQEPSFELCQELRYTEAVIKEALRMYPPLTQITRKVTKPTTMVDICLPKDSGVIIPVYNIQRDPEIYYQPDEFNPARFLDADDVIDPVTFLPFGFGPRQCIGKRLSLLELKVALVHILKHLRVVSVVPREVKLVEFAMMLKPVEPIMVKVECKN